jgi:hypothetical protein
MDWDNVNWLSIDTMTDFLTNTVEHCDSATGGDVEQLNVY